MNPSQKPTYIVRNRMHKVAQVTFPQLENIFTRKSDLFLNIAQLFPHPRTSFAIRLLYAKRYQDLVLQKEKCIVKMAKLAGELEEYSILHSILGIATNTAVRFIAEIGDIRRFDNNRQLNAYVGIDIRRYQSGKFMAKDKINKRGNKHLRKQLYLIIQN